MFSQMNVRIAARAMHASLEQNPMITGTRFVDGISFSNDIGIGEFSPGSGVGANIEQGKTSSKFCESENQLRYKLVI